MGWLDGWMALPCAVQAPQRTTPECFPIRLYITLSRLVEWTLFGYRPGCIAKSKCWLRSTECGRWFLMMRGIDDRGGPELGHSLRHSTETMNGTQRLVQYPWDHEDQQHRGEERIAQRRLAYPAHLLSTGHPSPFSASSLSLMVWKPFFVSRRILKIPRTLFLLFPPPTTRALRIPFVRIPRAASNLCSRSFTTQPSTDYDSTWTPAQSQSREWRRQRRKWTRA